MNVVTAVGMTMLGAAALLLLVRIYRGPSNLDRIVASEVLLIIVIAGIVMDAARDRSATSLPLLMILGLVSFVGGVAVTRFMAGNVDDGAADAPPAATAEQQAWQTSRGAAERAAEEQS